MTIKDVFENPDNYSFDVDQLGECVIDTPVKTLTSSITENARSLCMTTILSRKL